jgi:Flp pilus assembly protein TadG
MKLLDLGTAFYRRFRSDRSGQVALTFALAAVPMLGLAGLTMDYGHASFVKTDMQAALDATALAMSQNAVSMTSSQLQTAAQNYFNAQFQAPDAKNTSLAASYSTSGGSTIVLSATTTVPTYFMDVMGFKSQTVSASSTVKWGSTRLRVALVLDNTGSMSDSGKMTALKTATKNLLTQLQSAASNNGDVYVSIVPFVKDVNLGSSNYNANWVYWGTTTGSSAQDPSKTDNSSWDANNGSCSRGSSFSTRSECLQTSVCSNSRYTSKSSCQSAGKTWYSTAGTWSPDSHSTWNGCVMDRGYPMSPSSLSGNSGPDTVHNYDTNVTAPITTAMSSLFAAEQYSYCPQAATGLSYNWSTMTSLVNNMSPDGSTNQAIGLAEGWMSLAGGGPFTVPAMDPNYTYSQVIILLTDGLNTQDRWYGDGSSLGTSDDAKIDARQTLTCSNIKTAGITLYTVEVSTDGTPVSTLLQNCASSPTKFFYLTSASQIVTTFNAIGTNLSNLYVAK